MDNSTQKKSSPIGLILVGVCAALVLGMAALSLFGGAPKAGEQSLGTGGNSYVPITSSQVSVSGATSTAVLAINTNRLGARIQNLTTSTSVVCIFSSSKATLATAGLVLDAATQASSTITTYNLPPTYAGALNCIGTSGTSTIAVMEW